MRQVENFMRSCDGVDAVEGLTVSGRFVRRDSRKASVARKEMIQQEQVALIS
jgi:hypothetical protein